MALVRINDGNFSSFWLFIPTPSCFKISKSRNGLKETMTVANFVCFIHFHLLHCSIRAGRFFWSFNGWNGKPPQTCVSQNSRSETQLSEFHKGTITQKGNSTGNHQNPWCFLRTAMAFCILFPWTTRPLVLPHPHQGHQLHSSCFDSPQWKRSCSISLLIWYCCVL